MITVFSRNKVNLTRQINVFRGLSTDDKPLYNLAYPSKAEFEKDETKYYTKSGATYTQCSVGDDYATLGSAITVMGTGSATIGTSATFISAFGEPGRYEIKCVDCTVSAEVDQSATGVTDVTVNDEEKVKALFKTIGEYALVYDEDDGWTYSGEPIDVPFLTITGTPAADDEIDITLSSSEWELGGAEADLTDYTITVSGESIGDIIVCGVTETAKTFYTLAELNGSEFFEMDTGKTYYFDEDSAEWVDPTATE